MVISRQTGEKLLAGAAAVNCIVAPLLFWRAAGSLFPLPGLYFIEIGLLGLLGMAALLMESETSDSWLVSVPWLAAGGLLAFNILGAWTIGFYLLPATAAFLTAGILVYSRRGKQLWPGWGLLLMAASVQAAVILLLAQI